MAKVRKYKLSWNASDAETVIGYKLYWSKATEVNYDSKFIKVGKITEMELPDDVLLSDGPVMFGVTSIDKDGNESDMATIPEPYQLHVPEAPAGLSIIHSEEYKILDPKEAVLTGDEEDEQSDPLADAIESPEDGQPAKMKYYDDVGYRGLRV